MVNNGLKRFEDELTYNNRYGSTDIYGARIVLYYVMSQFIDNYVTDDYIDKIRLMMKSTYLDIISDK